jgi:ribosome maturation protein Sdo1
MYKAKSNDFVVIVESTEAVAKYRKDSSKPLIDVVDSFDIFVTNKHGSQGVLDRASKGQIENEFET